MAKKKKNNGKKQKKSRFDLLIPREDYNWRSLSEIFTGDDYSPVYYNVARREALKSGIRNQMGGGFLGDAVNKVIEKTPIELHIPSYQFCGGGTKFRERDAKGQRGINKLDNACYYHDKAYSQYKAGKERAQADAELIRRAEEIARDPSAGRMERFYANYIVKPAIGFMHKQNSAR